MADRLFNPNTYQYLTTEILRETRMILVPATPGQGTESREGYINGVPGDTYHPNLQSCHQSLDKRWIETQANVKTEKLGKEVLVHEHDDYRVRSGSIADSKFPDIRIAMFAKAR